MNSFQELNLNQQYTYADYLTWQFKERVELIKGKIFAMSPAPKRRHQDISLELSRQFANFLLGKSCKVYEAPFDVRIPVKSKQDEEVYTVVQPDLCVICDSNKLDEYGCVGAPDLIIEILSKSSSKKDLQDKFDLYQESGVTEYWIVSPNDQIVDVFLLEEDKYHLKGKYTDQDKVATYTIKGLEIDLNLVFAE